jgi:hypothetical protein
MKWEVYAMYYLKALMESNAKVLYQTGAAHIEVITIIQKFPPCQGRTPFVVVRLRGEVELILFKNEVPISAHMGIPA